MPARGETEGPLTLADLPAYREALGPARPDQAPPATVTFRDLWNRPDDYRNRRIAVAGRVERVFRQGPVGEFPALAEIWIVDPASNPFCLITPEPPAPKPGDSIVFDGTFLRRIRYRGGDADRLAPLVVGPGPARVERAAEAAGNPARRSSMEGLVVAVLAGVVVLALLKAHLRRPIARPIVEGPPPVFDDGAAGGYDGGREIDGHRTE